MIIDWANLMHRGIFGSKGEPEIRAINALDVVVSSTVSNFITIGCDHLVIVEECPLKMNWRKAIYDDYKNNRATQKLKLKPSDTEALSHGKKIFNDFVTLLRDYSNVSILNCDVAEGDDLIARWIDIHPESEHVIVSNDGDFFQLLNDNVVIMKNFKEILTLNRSFVLDDKHFANYNVNIIDESEQEFKLFEKVVRGDAGDNIFSAFPRVRKNSKTKPSIMTAFNDRFDKGKEWHDFMLSEWTHHKDGNVCVRDRFRLNEMLIDLKKQPDEVKTFIDASIKECVKKDIKRMIKNALIRFLDECFLDRLDDNLDNASKVFIRPYNGHLGKSDNADSTTS